MMNYDKPRINAPRSTIRINGQSYWADHIPNNSLIPIGGSLLSSELDDRIWTDFQELRGPDNTRISDLAAYHDEWKADEGSKLVDKIHASYDTLDDVELVRDASWARKVSHIIGIDQDVSNERRTSQRKQAVRGDSTASLSSLQGVYKCAELCMVSQRILNTIGYNTSLVQGLSGESPPSKHTYLIQDNLVIDAGTTTPGLCPVYSAKTNITEEAIIGSDAPSMIEATSVYDDKTERFGAGDLSPGDIL
jgi:hypothetical protein